MDLEAYFDFLAPDDIRIHGTRVGIETVLDDYQSGSSPEEIAARYRALSLEQVYATITYYLRNTNAVEAYLQEWRQYSEAAYASAQSHQSPAVARLIREKQRNPSSAQRLTIYS
ncbi:MAG: DUF433 domain-containing protein [Caldilineaceae bacterium]|nr:DUF433 domain-containing protein [Caldilineaceae bacterium]MCB9158276.1 DUF433 domain-containing protein [Caldilineaceae bacterium]